MFNVYKTLFNATAERETETNLHIDHIVFFKMKKITSVQNISIKTKTFGNVFIKTFNFCALIFFQICIITKHMTSRQKHSTLYLIKNLK